MLPNLCNTSAPLGACPADQAITRSTPSCRHCPGRIEAHVTRATARMRFPALCATLAAVMESIGFRECCQA